MARIALLALLVLTLAPSAGAADSKTPPETVRSVDLARYVGLWYEAGRLPNRFQRDCAGGVTAQYTIRDDGKITVLNSCEEDDGKIKRAKGTARVVDKTTNAKLKVTFFWPFSGDYWILDLGEQYEYAVVGDSKRKYLWILSREPQLDDATYQRALGRAAALGFDTSRVVRTPKWSSAPPQ